MSDQMNQCKYCGGMGCDVCAQGELSRCQFYSRAQEAADRVEALEAELERLRAPQTNSASKSSSNCAAPAAGTVEKDAERWRAFRARRSFGDLSATDFVLQFEEDADAIIDAAIEAHNARSPS